MAGALVFAAGVPRAFDERDFGIAVIGYVVMRIALVTQWVRAARDDVERRTTAYRYAVGVTACQVGWVAAALVPFDWWLFAFAVLGPIELLVPVWAESATPTSWHAEHIAERYGLFMIIVLVLAAYVSVQGGGSGSSRPRDPDLSGGGAGRGFLGGSPRPATPAGSAATFRSARTR